MFHVTLKMFHSFIKIANIFRSSAAALKIFVLAKIKLEKINCFACFVEPKKMYKQTILFMKIYTNLFIDFFYKVTVMTILVP